MVRTELPVVAVPELPDEPALYAWTLLNAGYFETVAYSLEDRVRSDQYRANAARAELASTIRNVDDFLVSLEMVTTFSPFTKDSKARITQLINKTNQFNLTTIRYTEADITEMMTDPNVVTMQVRLQDRFGDNGLIAVVIGRVRDGKEVLIDTWLMSCRVLGRKVEESIVKKLAEIAVEHGLKSLIGHYMPTDKNGMVKDLYGRLGFQRVDLEASGDFWRCGVADIDFGDLPFKID